MCFFKNPTAKKEEPQSLPSHGNQEHATIERHDSQHHHIGYTNPQSVQQSLD
jgi:hypothetical protein